MSKKYYKRKNNKKWILIVLLLLVFLTWLSLSWLHVNGIIHPDWTLQQNWDSVYAWWNNLEWIVKWKTFFYSSPSNGIISYARSIQWR